MQPDQALYFGPYSLDPVNEQLWRGSQIVKVTGKAWAVLRYLAGHSGQLVSKEALLAAVWPGVVVSDAALRSCIQELRQVLKDNAKRPRYIETVHRRGFRWIAPLSAALPVLSPQSPVPSLKSASLQVAPSPPHPFTLSPLLVGREAELAQLHGWLEKAMQGERQFVFVTGEPGIGKTALVDAFLAQIGEREEQKADTETRRYGDTEREGRSPRPPFPASPRRPASPPLPPSSPLIARGQCIEHYGPGEAYLPVLEVLEQLCRPPAGDGCLQVLRQYAPTWLAQMPGLLAAAEREQLERAVHGMTRERMLREMAEAVEKLTAACAVVLVIEDLQWSDVSTLDLLSLLARRRESARLLVIGTYRPVEVLVRDHPLKAIHQELQLHEQCRGMAPDFLPEAAVAVYLARRFAPALSPLPLPQGERGPASSLQRLAHFIHQRTDGNPLFMVTVVDTLLQQGVIRAHAQGWELATPSEQEHAVPQTIRQMIEQQRDRLSPDERHLLEAASVVGMEFSPAAVAVGMAAETAAVERRCEEMVRREQFFLARGTADWPDGTVAARYGFRHSVYQEVLYRGVPVGQRIRLHQQIGERLEMAYRERTGEIAAELAMHFEQGRDYQRAVQYLQRAADNALRRSAHVEAIKHLRQALVLLTTLPDTPERTQHELTLQIALGAPLIATQGFAALEVEQVYARARALCRQIGETPQLFPVLGGLFAFYAVRGELATAHELAEQLLKLAHNVQDPLLFLVAHSLMGIACLHQGELVPARIHLEQGLALYDPQQYGFLAALSGLDPGVVCLSHASWTLWLLGYPDQALRRSQEAITLAQELSHPFSRAFALVFAAVLHQYRREAQASQERAQAGMALVTEQGFAQGVAAATIMRGWALAAQGQEEAGITDMRQGLAAYQTMGAALGRAPQLALLIEVCGQVGQVNEGLTLLDEALTVAHQTGQRYYEAELWRLKGELTLEQLSVASCQFKKSKRQRPRDRHGDMETRSVQDSPRVPPSPRPRVVMTSNPHAEAEAEACFHKAIAIARQQSAKSLELRAVTSLSRLWQRQRKTHEAHRVLAEVCAWFTEGFDTLDLQEAGRLRVELERACR